MLTLCAALAAPAVADAAEGQPGLIAQTVSAVTQAAGSTVSQTTTAVAQTADAVVAGTAAPAGTPPPAQDVAGVVETTNKTVNAAKASTAKVVRDTAKKVTRDVGAATSTATKTVAGVTRTAKDAVSTVTEPASGAVQIASAIVAGTTTTVERSTGGNAETMAEPGSSALAPPAAPEVERGTTGAVLALPSLTSDWTALVAGATTQAPGFFGALLIDDPPLVAGVESADRAGSRRAANARRPFPLDLPGGPLDGLLTSMSAGGAAPAIPPVFAALVAAFLLAAFGPGRLLRPDSALLRPPLQLSALERPG